ncbi:MAG: diaminobutyrate--2-oxoglutarate transaminase [Deltaproteobacteria bacterium]|jgi:diaminobutyrate-2-oxoglutarate transaminase|nr:diaminobutyrate--2-oxoglutarate transaminase [Deltaproteobacteria bacterium]
MKPFDRLESEVRSYCRSFPETFARAKGSCVIDEAGEEYIDFFAGAGVMSYGHNNEHLKSALLEYIAEDGITHGLDMATEAKAAFLDAFDRIVLQPRGLQYRIMFPGPTGTNSVEAALKLARKVTKRVGVVAFTNGFHGMTLGSLALTGNHGKRAGAGVPLTHVTRMPFDGYFGDDVDTLEYADTLLSDASSGVDKPAAFIVETVQAEGGINVASDRWLRGLQALARKHGALLIVDDIQVGCGRTGPFFSFEKAGVQPDIVCLSKALSGYGLPFALTLIRPDLDVWKPGEHNGTFRGNNLAFVTARAALERYWTDGRLESAVGDKAKIVKSALDSLAEEFGGEVRGRGLIQGLALDPSTTAAVCREAFRRGVVIETAGAQDEVVKILPPLTIQPDILDDGLTILRDAVEKVLDYESTQAAPQSLQITP